MKRITLFIQGSSSPGKVTLVPKTMHELILITAEKFNLQTTEIKLFTQDGGLIEEVDAIKDDEMIFVNLEKPITFGKIYDNPNQQVETKGDEAKLPKSTSDWISLNVGGHIFTTTRSTLTNKDADSMLCRMFAESSQVAPSPQDSTGAYLIDRSPEYFEPILGWLRHGQLIINDGLNPRGVLAEARFYGIEVIVNMLEHLDELPSEVTDIPLARRDVVKALIGTSCSSELRFQGVNLNGADLSKLDLRHINLKYATLRGANLSGSNLSYTCLERADLFAANLDGAILFGVKMVCANLREASLKGINCEDPMNVPTNMEGVNLKSANLDGSQLAHVNLRVATLKNAVLSNCDLRGAILAGADLEHCNLSGSDLHEANLRGANLKGATFELMMTPLHMAQAIGR